VEILTDFMEHIAVEGRQTARDMYGARGWTIHHCVSALGRTGLHDGLISGILPLAGAWMMLHMFEHYEYTQDLKYLKRIEPLLKGSCEFICDFLVIGPQG
jgi:alpha-L-fucosidase 2